MDAPTIAISVLSSGAVATIVAKVLDTFADRRRAALADEAADKALYRHARSVRVQEDLERRAAQRRTVDAIVGHVSALVERSGRVGELTSAGLTHALTAPEITDVDLGRLAETDEGRAV